MSTDTSSLFQMVHERGRQQRVGNMLRGRLAREFSRWLKSKRVWLYVLIWLLIINLILFLTTSSLSKATQAAAAAGESPPKVETVLLFGICVGVLVAVGVMISVRGAIVAEKRAGRQMQSKLEVASQWARGRGLNAGREPIDSHTEYNIRLARILLAQESLDQAIQILQRPLEVGEKGERIGRTIEIQSHQASSFQARGKSISAMAALERTPVELEQTAAPKTQTSQQAALESLSERELQVLELIAEGLTNTEIAARLFLSPHTVKAHTRNIYGKLDAHSRTQAVARARVLGVLF